MVQKLPENDPLNKYIKPTPSNDGSRTPIAPAYNKADFQKRKGVSPKYWLWGGVFAIIIIVLIVGTMVAPSSMDQAATTQSIPQTVDAKAITPESKHAMEKLVYEMPRDAVTTALGGARWAVIPGDKGPFAIPNTKDIGLELYWENPGCRVIRVSFSQAPYKTLGWDEGTGHCDQSSGTPDDALYSCQKPDRAQFCR